MNYDKVKETCTYIKMNSHEKVHNFFPKQKQAMHIPANSEYSYFIVICNFYRIFSDFTSEFAFNCI